MAAPYIKVFDMPPVGKITSVVLDREDFDKFIDELGEIRDLKTGALPTKEDLDKFKEVQNLPMMRRGTKTVKFFERWGITTETCSVIVRGAGRKLAARLLG